MDTHNPNTTVPDPRETVVRYLGRFQEALWLAIAIGVPLVVVQPGFMLSHTDAPKIALLRVLVSLMAMVWMVEWLVRPGAGWRQVDSWKWRRLGLWLKEDPTRWVLLTLGLYLLVNVAAAATSASPAVSVWGKKPGGDGYGLYNLVAYAVLFLVVIAHLRHPEQRWRLLAAVLVAGTLVGAYGILQYVGLDPVQERISAPDRAYSSLGNPVFAGAFLLVTCIISVAFGLALYQNRRPKWALVVGAALLIQVLAILFTLTRGAWVGLAVGVGLLLIMLALAGARQAGRVSLAVALTVLVGIGIAIGLGAVAASAEPDDEAEEETRRTVVQRALSIYPQIAGGGVAQRLPIWKAGADLLRERPWSDVLPAQPVWVRHLLGYGPDMFRYVSPLRNEPMALAQVPFEAHNVPLHVAVELGSLGLLAFLAAGTALLIVGFRRYFGDGLSPTQRTLLAGLMATFVGKGVEMMVGIPKVGDLTILVLLLAAFVGLLRVSGAKAVSAGLQGKPSNPPSQRTTQREWAGLLTRAALVFAAIVALGVFTWVKGFNYARADAMAASALARFEQGKEEEGIRMALKASGLAPDVPDYYLLTAGLFDELGGQNRSADGRYRLTSGYYFYSRRAVDANELDPAARASLANAALSLGLLGERDRLDQAVALSEEVLSMMPNFAVSYYAAALPHLLIEDADTALERLDAGDALHDITKNKPIVAESAFLRRVAYRLKGETTTAIEWFERSLAANRGRYESTVHRHLGDLYESIGDRASADEHRKAVE